MNSRYKKSLLFTILIYSAIFALYLSLEHKKKQTSANQPITISVISQSSAPKMKIQKPQESQKKTPPIKNDALTPKKVVQDTKEKSKAVTANLKKTDTNTTQKEQSTNLDEKRNVLLSQIYKAIKSNKKYPEQAIENGIEGEVAVKFTLESNGTATNILLLSGNNLLKAATKDAIMKSFPFIIPKELEGELPTDIDLTLSYRLNK